MALGKVLARGQVTLPRDIRREACVRPGDTVTFRVTGPGTIEVKLLPRLSFTEALERYHIAGPVDLDADRPEWQARAADDVLGKQDD